MGTKSDDRRLSVPSDAPQQVQTFSASIATATSAKEEKRIRSNGKFDAGSFDLVAETRLSNNLSYAAFTIDSN